MAKGKGKQAYGPRRASAIDPFDDTMSEASSATILTGGARDDEEETVIDVYQDNLDLLFEKRGATRVRAFGELIAYMKVDVREYEAEKNCMTLVSRCLDSIRKGGANERELAATALGLHIISLPGASERLFTEMQRDLDVAAAEGPAEARSAAIETMAMTCYVAAQDEFLTRQILGRMQQLWRKGDAGPRAAALRGWSLLFTSLESVLSGDEVESLLEQMAALMGDKSVEVRSAAGEVVALLCGSYRFLQQYADSDGDAHDDDGQESESSADIPENLDHLVGRMRDLATHNRHDALRTSKRDKAALRTTFRGILEAVEEGTVKAEKIKLKHGDVLCVDTLAGKVALGAFKRMLAGGLQAHLQRNPLLHDVFGFLPSGEAPARLGYLEKRHFRSPSSALSKGKTALRKSDRAYKSSRQAGPAGFGGEEY